MWIKDGKGGDESEMMTGVNREQRGMTKLRLADEHE